MMHTYLSCDTLFLGQEIEQWDNSSIRSIHCLLCLRLSACSMLSNQLRSDCMYHSRGTKCDNVMISFYSCVSIYSDVVRFYSPRDISSLKSRKQQLRRHMAMCYELGSKWFGLGTFAAACCLANLDSACEKKQRMYEWLLKPHDVVTLVTPRTMKDCDRCGSSNLFFGTFSGSCDWLIKLYKKRNIQHENTFVIYVP